MKPVRLPVEKMTRCRRGHFARIVIGTRGQMLVCPTCNQANGRLGGTKTRRRTAKAAGSEAPWPGPGRAHWPKSREPWKDK